MAKKPRNDAMEVSDEPKVSKSIVPAKYSGRYKGGGVGGTADFINGQAGGKDGIEFPAFFDLARKNDLPEETIAKHESEIAEKRHGAEGRARMTLGNMFRARARKNGKLVDLNGNDVEVNEPKLVTAGSTKNRDEEAVAA